jgi:hypothetical protein
LRNTKARQSIIVPLVVLFACVTAFGMPLMVLGGSPPVRDDVVLRPVFSPTATPLDRALTQRAFAVMFFTPTLTAAPEEPIFAFLVPNTGATQTFTPRATITNTITESVTPSRTLIPVFQTQTRANDGGGGGGGGGGSTFTSTPFRTATPGISPSPTRIANLTLTVFVTATLSPSPVPSNTVPPPTETPTVEPKPTNTDIPPTDTVVPPTSTPVPPTDIPTNPPVPTDTSVPGGNVPPGTSSATARYLGQFVFMSVMGAAFVGMVFRRQ